MFVFSEWQKICNELSSRFTCIRADQILNQPSDSKWIVIKHDVETNVPKAMELAKIEATHNISATYYVQADLLNDNYKELQEIASLGHEVTYHYDVLDFHNGDYQAAENTFSAIVKEFNTFGFDIKTVCPHGNPIKIRNGWSSNKDFFRNAQITSHFPTVLDIVVHLPTRLHDSYIYISDAGYGWKKIVNVQDNDKTNHGDIPLKSHADLLNAIKAEKRLIISTHPHRWEKSKLIFFLKTLFFKAVRYTAKALSSIGFFKRIMSKYYYLAKRI